MSEPLKNKICEWDEVPKDHKGAPFFFHSDDVVSAVHWLKEKIKEGDYILPDIIDEAFSDAVKK